MRTVVLFIILAGVINAQGSYFEKEGLTEMLKINKDPLYAENKYMLGYFSEDGNCNEVCKNAIKIMKQVKEEVKERIPDIKLIFVNGKENKKLVRDLRVVDVPSIAYLANKRVVIYNGEDDAESLKIWLKKRVILPSEGYSSGEDIDGMKDAWNLVVTYAGKRNRYYEMFRYVASSYADLHFGHSFSAPVNLILIHFYSRS